MTDQEAWQQDADNIRKDFEAVGRDIWKVIDRMERKMKYVVKPGPQAVEVYKLDGFSIGRTPIAIVEGTRIDFVGGFSLLGDSEFIAAVLSLGLETFPPIKTTDVPTPRHLEEVYEDAEVVKTVNIPTPQQLEDSRAALVGYGWKHPRTFLNPADIFPVQALPDGAVPIFVRPV